MSKNPIIIKLIVALLFFIQGFTNSYSQCIPDDTQTEVGCYPQTPLEGFVNAPFSEVVTIVPRDDTTIVVAPIGPIPIPMDSAKLVSVNGLPTGLGSTCQVANCTYISPGGEMPIPNFCNLLSGVPTTEGMYTVEYVIEYFYTVPIQGADSFTESCFIDVNISSPIPTMGEWGLIILTMLILLVSIVSISNMRAKRIAGNSQ